MLVKFKSQDVYGGFVMVGNKKRILDRKKNKLDGSTIKKHDDLLVSMIVSTPLNYESC